MNDYGTKNLKHFPHYRRTEQSSFSYFYQLSFDEIPEKQELSGLRERNPDKELSLPELSGWFSA